MRTFTLFIISFFASLSIHAQIVDAAPSGNKNVRAVMGSGEKANIDKTTPLPQLLNKLTTDWKFIETGKAYWIGYTDDMYSIANHSDKAIKPLINFIDTTHNLQAKLGALYTLHLVGINSTIVGRFHEDFLNKDARNALLKYLNNNELNETVVSLLMRDPWLSDVPQLINYLALPNRDHSKVLSALRRYEINSRPLGQKISNPIFQRYVTIKMRGNETDPIFALITFRKEFTPYFIVDKEITEENEWENSLNELSSINKAFTHESSVNFFLQSNKIFYFADFDNSYYYEYQNDSIKIYGPKKARKIWLDWWKTIPDNQRDKLFSTDHIAFN